MAPLSIYFFQVLLQPDHLDGIQVQHPLIGPLGSSYLYFAFFELYVFLLYPYQFSHCYTLVDQ